MIGRWIASRENGTALLTRAAARLHIEETFDATVLETLEPIDFVELRTVVLRGPDGEPPGIALVCESVGQLDLGWIETSDAPIAWRAAAYHALERMLGRALPVFAYQDLFEVIAHYYWDGETEDEGALQALVEYHGADPNEREDLSLPSEMSGRRPDWMIAANAGRPQSLPTRLRQALYDLAQAHRSIGQGSPGRSAWTTDFDLLCEYIPGIEECSSLPPLTLVPVEHFACEVDDVGRQGMELGFMDVAGLCQLADPTGIDEWFTSLRLGVRFLAAAQALLRLDPATL